MPKEIYAVQNEVFRREIKKGYVSKGNIKIKEKRENERIYIRKTIMLLKIKDTLHSELECSSNKACKFQQTKLLNVHVHLEKLHTMSENSY